MMLRNLDWNYLRSAIVTISIAVVVTALLAYASYTYRMGAEAVYDAELALYRDVEGKLRDIDEDKKFIETYAERFSALESSGIFTMEQRVNWVDNLHAAILEMKLSNVKYEVSPQGTSADNLVHDVNSVHIHSSPLKMEMNLLHEQDMITLLDRLERNVMGRFLIDSCEMKRAEAKFGYYLDRHNLRVICNMRWITLSPAVNEDNMGQL